MDLKIDFSTVTGVIKPMNAVNNGPAFTENEDQNGTNLPDFKAANIPYARVHDASICYDYGGEHTVDVLSIFPDFNADENDPDSYDFTLTDDYLSHIMLAGAQVFFRLGNKIEHWKKHYGIMPPPDFNKWAVVCEHIIAHMNEGWADGHRMNIEYWEIWNEPDGYNKCWTGTDEEFYELFAVTAKHLKNRFPNIKVGGPALCWVNEKWLRPFFTKIRNENVPLDFFSWHAYSSEVSKITDQAKAARALLDEFGFYETESILNEWNYVKGWSEPDWTYSKKTERSSKGAAFIGAVMSACQKEKTDMLMYYDARTNSTMNGLFDIYTLEKAKGYYPIMLWGKMLNMKNECFTECTVPDVYVTAASNGSEHVAVISYFTDQCCALPLSFKVKLNRDGLYTLSVLDETRDLIPYELAAAEDGEITITMQPNTIITIE